MEHIRYKKETEVVTFQGKEITLENLSPVFTPEQEVAKRRELEQRLGIAIASPFNSYLQNSIWLSMEMLSFLSTDCLA